MRATLTHAEAVARIEAKHGGKIAVLGQYKTANDGLAVRCECGHQWNSKPHHLFDGRGCRKCSEKRSSEEQRLSHSEAVARIELKHSGTITVLGQYVNSYSKLAVRCECGYLWQANPAYLFKGGKCPECSKNSTRLSQDEAIERIKARHGNKITVIGQYSGNHSPMTVRCQCGHQWEPNPGKLFQGRGCPECAKKQYGKTQRLNHQEVVRRIETLFAGKITVLGHYKSSTTRLPVQCDCGHQWAPVALSLLAGCGCSKCGHQKNSTARRLSHDQVITRIKEIHGETLYISDRYKSTSQRLTVRCQCGHQWKPLAGNLLAGKGCRKCALRQMGEASRLTHEEVLDRIAKAHGDKITVLGQYKGGDKKLAARCQCGHQWEPRANDLFTAVGNGCPKCAMKRSGEAQRLSHTEALARINAQHGDKITVIGRYAGIDTNLTVRCQCGHQWGGRPHGLFTGRGCPKCAEYGFQFKKPAIAYYLRVATLDAPIYKIGVTNRTVAERFRSDLAKITILKIWNFTLGTDAFEFEQRILRENAFDLYRGPEILRNGGNDELFVCDVLGLDVNQPQLDLAFVA